MSKRVMQATVELSMAERDFKRAEKEAHRDKKPMPAPQREKLMSAISLARANLRAAEAAAYAMNRFPPIGRAA